MDARPKEVTLPSIFSETKDTWRITSITQKELIRDAEEEKDLLSEVTLSNQEEYADSEDITIRFPRSVKKNTCIKEFKYRVIYGYFFAIPICKKHKGCKDKMKTVNFSNGKTLTITYDCYK